MPEYVPLKGFEQLQDALKVHGSQKCLIYMYFFGEKDAKTGKSWCPDCVNCEYGRQTLLPTISLNLSLSLSQLSKLWRPPSVSMHIPMH